MTAADQLNVKLYCDGASIDDMLTMNQFSYIQGFTTNPTLMRKAGISDYEEFAKNAIKLIPNKPISFEVFADDEPTMKKQALILNSWGENVYVKIPVMNTLGEPTYKLISELSREGIKLNVTAIMTLDQVQNVAEALSDNVPSIVSVFAGRIADTGIDPLPVMKESLRILKNKPLAELLWASPREVFNVYQANEMGCHIITATPGILGKLDLNGKNLTDFSQDTVKMFYEDAKNSNFSIG